MSKHRNPPHFPKTKTVGGRAEGESVPGSAALVNHGNRHKTPGILAQTAPKRIPGADRVKRALVSSAMGSSNNVLAVEEIRRDEALIDSLRALKPLPVEPVAAIVNIAPARENLMSGKLRVGLSTALVFIAEIPVYEKIGRLSAVTVTHDPDSNIITLRATKQEKGYQWGPYRKNQKPNTVVDEYRMSFTRKHQVIPDTVPNFGLTEGTWELEGDELTIILDANELVNLRQSAPKGGYHVKSPVPPEEPRKGKEPIIGEVRSGSVTVSQNATAEERLDALPLDGSPLVEVPEPDPVTKPEPKRSVVGEIAERDDMDVTIRQLRDAVRMINEAKEERGDELRFYIDTTTGKLVAKVEVTL